MDAIGTLVLKGIQQSDDVRASTVSYLRLMCDNVLKDLNLENIVIGAITIGRQNFKCYITLSSMFWVLATMNEDNLGVKQSTHSKSSASHT